MADHINEELISAYIDDAISKEDRHRIDRALADSPELAELHAQLLALKTRWDKLPPEELPPGFHDRLMARLAGESVARKGPAAWSSAGIGAAALAVAAVALLVFFTGYDPDRSGAGPGGGSIAQQPTPGSRSEPEGLVDWSEESLVYFQAGDADRPQYSLVIDVTVTELGRTNRAFENALKQVGIPLDPNLAVADELEESILSSRMVNNIELDTGEAGEPRSSIEMTYVVADGAKIDALYANIKARPAEFSPDPAMDITVTDADRLMMLDLNQSSRRRFAAAVDRRKETLAHRLTFSRPLRGTLSLLGAISASALNAPLSDTPDTEFPELDLAPVPTPAGGSSSDTPAGNWPGAPQLAQGGVVAQVSEVLFILRYPPE